MSFAGKSYKFCLLKENKKLELSIVPRLIASKVVKKNYPESDSADSPCTQTNYLNKKYFIISFIISFVSLKQVCCWFNHQNLNKKHYFVVFVYTLLDDDEF